jgi:transposase
LNPNSRKLWAPRGSKPIQLVNGSHQNVCFFGAVSDEKRHCCTAKWINENSFINFLKYLLKMNGKIAVIADRATHHFKSQKVKDFTKKLKDKIILWPLPKRFPELNPMEPGWKSARKNITYKLFDSKKNLGWAVKSHIRREFRICLTKFWN